MVKFEKRDTQQLQMDSVKFFMAGMSYSFVGCGWETDAPGMQHMRRISHRNAIALHNLSAEQWEEFTPGFFRPTVKGATLDFAINGYALAQLSATKLVQKVKMQPNKKTVEGVEVQSQMLKPMQPYMTQSLGLVA